jgi:nucleoid-associated protein YgaU
MSLRRLVLTAASMALVAVALAALTPAVPDMAGALASAQRTADTMGPDALVVAAAGLLAWVVWGWGVLGLALTAASALPGMLGSAARLATHVVLPAGARRSAALLLGLGIGVAGPLVATSTVLATPAVAAVPAGAVPDWPAAPSADRVAAAPAAVPAKDPVPDWSPAFPTPPEEDRHVVVRGDCLWHIAESWLLARSGAPPTDGQIARAVHDWWTANSDVIGPDPDRLLPGQLLRPPGAA